MEDLPSTSQQQQQQSSSSASSFTGLENLPSMKKFVVPPKGSTSEDLEGWRKASFTLNPSRRYRYVADLKKRKEAEEARQQFQKFRVSLDAVKAAWRFHDGKSKTLVLKFCLEKSSMTVFFAHVSKSPAEYKLLRFCTILFFSMFTNQTFFWSFQVAIHLFSQVLFVFSCDCSWIKACSDQQRIMEV
jgi:hypothetical protein